MIRPLLPSGAGNSEIFTRHHKSFRKIHQLRVLAEHPERQWSQPPDLPSVSGVRLRSCKESSWCVPAPRAQASPHPVPPGCGAQPCDDHLVAQMVKNLPAMQETPR